MGRFIENHVLNSINSWIKSQSYFIVIHEKAGKYTLDDTEQDGISVFFFQVRGIKKNTYLVDT